MHVWLSLQSPVKGGRKKKEEEKEVWKWWEETPHPKGVKWLTLEHNVCLPPLSID